MLVWSGSDGLPLGEHLLQQGCGPKYQKEDLHEPTRSSLDPSAMSVQGSGSSDEEEPFITP